MSEIYVVIFKIIGVYVLIVTILGTIFNTLTIYICRKVKHNSLFTFYQFYNFASTLGMYYWNLNYFVEAYGPYPNLFQSTWICRIGSFIQYSTLQLIGWNISIQCLDRYLQVRIPKWRKHYFGGQRPFYSMVGLSFFIALFNSNVLFTYGYSEINGNNSITYYCYQIDDIPSTQWMGTWNTVNSIMCSYFPILLAAVSTLLFLYFIKQRQNKVNIAFHNFHSILSIKRIRSIMISVPIWCFLVSFPNATSHLFYSKLIKTDYGNLVLSLTNIWIFTILSLNFFFLVAINQYFKYEAKKIFRIFFKCKSKN